jgi:integrase
LRHKSRQVLRLYLLPRFGQQSLSSISRGQIKTFLANLAKPGSSACGRSLSRNSLRLVLCTLRVILSHAQEGGKISSNPAQKLGRFTKIDRSQQKKATALSREEAEQFLLSAQEVCPVFYPLFLTALRAGLRRGELIALEWGDIQFGTSEQDSNRYILVQHNWVNGRSTSPKNRKSRRVDMSRQLRAALLELRDQRLLEAYLQGKKSIAGELVFPSETGTVLQPENLYHRYFLPILEHAGLRRIRLHDLRHF